MDIRFVAWAGYDLRGTTAAAIHAGGGPNMAADVEGSQKMTARDVRPSMKGRPNIQDSPRVISDEFRPFPGPRNI